MSQIPLIPNIIMAPDTRANQPAANTVSPGTIYCVSDEDNLLERSDGSAWAAYSPTGGASVLVQEVYTLYSTNGTTTNTVPFDNTAPQQGGSEGAEFFTRTITPTDAANILEIVVNVQCSATTVNNAIAFLCQDAVASALATGYAQIPANNAVANITFTHLMAAGTTSAITFRVRAGLSIAGTLTMNGQNSGALFGGTLKSSIVVREYIP